MKEKEYCMIEKGNKTEPEKKKTKVSKNNNNNNKRRTINRLHILLRQGTSR